MLKGSEKLAEATPGHVSHPQKESTLPSSFSISQCNILVSGMLSSLKPTTCPFEDRPNLPQNESRVTSPFNHQFSGEKVVSFRIFSTPPWQNSSKLCASAACGNAGKFEKSGILYKEIYIYIHTCSVQMYTF